jgi:hypothetical protein
MCRGDSRMMGGDLAARRFNCSDDNLSRAAGAALAGRNNPNSPGLRNLLQTPHLDENCLNAGVLQAHLYELNGRPRKIGRQSLEGRP